ncbi:Cellulose biosynthesis protein BcsQ [Frankia canadensis]|uniref:Cellulose biosynthesis protein BcsQ n=1 Tax=Frankia canadensis TaxID=1836972 RepID=A0A2I2L157_9ACTN|nr:ParA family protein [Frankia canadensis]SNQ51662.1 Cellulose biosynthesis protein BcsQ [Frankia canadensis]SOU58952.1 Cellulose biosynthesis protein BcsQ [Frankia canadensis]
MRSYAFWNNKGGVGKSFLCFIAACEYAHRNPDSDVYVIDLCPQGNVSETLLGGYQLSAAAIDDLVSRQPRATIAGYLEARLSSPFRMLDDVSSFVVRPSEVNKSIPENLLLICGDNLLEVLSEAIRQTSQLVVPVDAWRQVIEWVKDLTLALSARSGDRDSLFVIDCNPSFAIYTQLALAACQSVIVPFTADDSSRRAIQNVVALLYGIGDAHIATYARINFAKRAIEERVQVPKLHAFVSNRVTQYRGNASRAFAAVAQTIAQTLDDIYKRHRTLFTDPSKRPSDAFIEIPDYHGACIVASMTGTPLHRLYAGPRNIAGERVQLNSDPLDRYKSALGDFVDSL